MRMLNQYTVYQLSQEKGVYPWQFRSYQYVLENHLRVEATQYCQVYQETLFGGETAAGIRQRLEQKLPKRFTGRALCVSDVIVITKDGIVNAYYVDEDSLVLLAGFFRNASSSSLVTLDTVHYVIEGRTGTWMAADEEMVDGRHFFLMQSELYGEYAKLAVIDENGRTAAKDTKDGFTEATLQQIREFLVKEQQEKEQIQRLFVKPEKEIWERYLENGEYFRRLESTTEDGYSFIDGRVNNQSERNRKAYEKEAQGQKKQALFSAPLQMKQEQESPATGRTGRKPPEQRTSLLRRLREKQAELAANTGISDQEQMLTEELQRNRK